MVTNTPSRVLPSGYREEDRHTGTVALHKHAKTLLSRRRILKWFGALSTALIGAAALAPGAFRIPTSLQPWIFLASIFWFLAFCAGLFDL